MTTATVELSPLKHLDGVEIKRIFGGGTAWLEPHVPYINSLNVFPVPDGDSGTNMLLTMQAALREVERSPSHSAGEVLGTLSHGALLGARGNSGVILSQIIRGMARSVDGRGRIDTGEFAAAMVEGSRTAYKGVVKPVEGTILTVIREAADAAVRAARESDDFLRVLEQSVGAARTAVQKTPLLLPVLKEAGVVDAGGEGLFVLLEGALKYLKNEPLSDSGSGATALKLEQLGREEGWGYDIQFHIRGHGLNVEAIREHISSMGESALIVGDDRLLKVHVHAPNPGDIIKYGAEQGSLVNITIENMQEQYVDFMSGNTADRRVGAENLGTTMQPPAAPVPPAVPAGPVKSEEPAGTATIAVAPGEGLRRIFESLHIGAVVNGGPTMNPSTEDLLKAVRSVKANQVLILPNDKNIILAAMQVKQLSDKQIEVVPTRTVPQGIAALLAFNYMSDLDANLRAMTAAAQHMRTVEVTTATRSVKLNGLEVREGQCIGLIDGELAGASDDRDELLVDLLKRVDAKDSEILTLYYGGDLTDSEAEQARARIQQAFPGQQIEMHPGGQPLYQYIISVE